MIILRFQSCEILSSAYVYYKITLMFHQFIVRFLKKQQFHNLRSS